MIQDLINGSFEILAGLAVLHHCAVLRRDRQVRGLSIPAVFFFTAWGFWNIYYYPFLGQPFSFAGGIFVTAANCAYLALLIFYSQGRMPQRIKRWALCSWRGHRNDSPSFTFGYDLYPCKHCGQDIFGNTWEDIEPLTDEMLDDLHREIALEGER
ncbi:MAG: hypothetical protein PHQ05_05090 [Sterolibacterium sp.]|nr:hypothetical protein [Sterolibacterium sp.]